MSKLTLRHKKTIYLFYLHSLHRLPLSSNVLREICAYLPIPFIPYIWGDQLQLYNHNGDLINTRQLSKYFEGTSFVRVDETRIICMGMDLGSRDVYSLNIATLALLTLPCLIVSRAWPSVTMGIGRTEDVIFVFGGDQDSSCEKYKLTETVWRSVGHMRYNVGYNAPCLYHSQFYLTCTCFLFTRSIETFDPDTELFSELSIKYPDRLNYGCPSISFIANGELVIVTIARQMARWKIETETSFNLSYCGKACGSNQLPVVFDSFVLVPNDETAKAEKFSLESFSFLA